MTDLIAHLGQVNDYASFVALVRDAQRALDTDVITDDELAAFDHSVPDWDGPEMRALVAAATNTDAH